MGIVLHLPEYFENGFQRGAFFLMRASAPIIHAYLEIAWSEMGHDILVLVLSTLSPPSPNELATRMRWLALFDMWRARSKHHWLPHFPVRFSKAFPATVNSEIPIWISMDHLLHI